MPQFAGSFIVSMQLGMQHVIDPQSALHPVHAGAVGD